MEAVMGQAACFFVLLGAAAPYGSSQSQPPLVKTITTGLVIDATVLDPARHPLLHLRPDAFELTGNRGRETVVFADTVRTTFQAFANQAESLRQGVSRVTSPAPVNLAAGAERSATTRVQGFDPTQPPTAGAESGRGFSQADRQALFDPKGDKDSEILLRLPAL